MGTTHFYNMCGCFSRIFWEAEPSPPEDVKRLFEKYAGEGRDYMSPENLRRFLEVEQAATTDHPPEKIVESLLEELKDHHCAAEFTKNNSLSLEGFFYYLFSANLNPPFHPKKVHQDMNAPLSHYFIFTGHNSYLTGNQLSSKSSDIPIKTALERGVRVIELDLWSTSPDEILVHHGRTLTTSVDLSECLETIKSYAFVSSEYPVIITLEDHLCPKLQDKAKQMIMQTFGEEMLYYPEPGNQTEFPSPEALKKKILISTKPPKEYKEAAQDPPNGKDTDRKFPFGCFKFITWKNTCLEQQNSVEPNECASAEISHYTHDKNNQDDPVDQNEYKVLTYKNLIAIQQTRKKLPMKDSLQIDPAKVWRLSLNEEEVKKLATSHGNQVVWFTQRNILRIYPKGARVDSSNYNPFVGWLHGAQMVAFNMQGHGRWLEVMRGMFKANGGCGYVKKPDFLINGIHVFDPKTKLQAKEILKVKVYMGDGWRKDFKKTYFDKCSPPDFYTKIRVREPAVGVKKEGNESQRTMVANDKWIPVWGEEFSFQLVFPELAVLEIRVHESDSGKDDFAGQICLPVSELKDGIRAVPLYCRKGDQDEYKSVKLLVRFNLLKSQSKLLRSESTIQRFYDPNTLNRTNSY